MTVDLRPDQMLVQAFVAYSLDAAEDRATSGIVINVPPRFGLTAALTRSFVGEMAKRGKRCLIISYVEDFAKHHARAAEDAAGLNRGTILGSGVFGSIGMVPPRDLIVVDTPMRNWTDGRNERHTKHVVDFLQVAATRLVPGGLMVIAGSRYGKADLFTPFLAKGWPSLVLPGKPSSTPGSGVMDPQVVRWMYGQGATVR